MDQESLKSVENIKTSAKASIGNYDIIKTIGEGSFAKVKLAVHRITREKVALKIVHKKHLPDEYSVKNLYRESQIMKLLNHPYIVCLYEIIETKREIILVLDYAAGGEVLDYIVAHGRLREGEAKRFIYEISDALLYCHSNNVVHRDLKAENLLLDKEMHIKITDFGLSSVYNPKKNLETFCGSPAYCSPELIDGRAYVGPEVDCWALGVIIYGMVVGDLPFSQRDMNSLYDHIAAAEYRIPEYVSDECKDLIKSLLIVNPQKRFTIKEVLSHPWLKEAIPDDGISKLQETTSLSMEEIEPEILAEMLNLKISSREDIIKSLKENKCDSNAATYKLMKIKMKKVLEARKKAVYNAAPKRTIVSSKELPAPSTDSSPSTSVENVSFSSKTLPREQKNSNKIVKEVRPRSLTVDASILTNASVVSPPLSPLVPTSQRATTKLGHSDPIELLKSEAKGNESRGNSSSFMGSTTSADEDGVRTVRFAFNISTSTHLLPEEIEPHVIRALKTENITFEKSAGFIFQCSTEKEGRSVDFEVEICKIPLLALRGIRFKRVRGDIWAYKRICSGLMVHWSSINKEKR